MKATWLIIAALTAFAFYGSGTGKIQPAEMLEHGESWHEKDASFDERFGLWAYDGKGFRPLESVAQCTTDSDCEEKFGTQD